MLGVGPTNCLGSCQVINYVILGNLIYKKDIGHKIFVESVLSNWKILYSAKTKKKSDWNSQVDSDMLGQTEFFKEVA